MSDLSFLSPEAQAVLHKACAYCDIPQTTCEECDGPLFPTGQKLFAEPAVKICIASGEDAYAFED